MKEAIYSDEVMTAESASMTMNQEQLRSMQMQNDAADKKLLNMYKEL